MSTQEAIKALFGSSSESDSESDSDSDLDYDSDYDLQGESSPTSITEVDDLMPMYIAGSDSDGGLNELFASDSETGYFDTDSDSDSYSSDEAKPKADYDSEDPDTINRTRARTGGRSGRIGRSRKRKRELLHKELLNLQRIKELKF